MYSELFYRGKRVFITGHTGFKGTWICKMLLQAGAIVTGYSLEQSLDNNLFSITNIETEKKINSIIGDVRDLGHLQDELKRAEPEIVIHMAAQPLVRASYVNPVYTYETNVLGTVNICEAIRNTSCVKSFVNVTTDKVYKNEECKRGYREIDELNGYDPYSNSKSCSELITASYTRSFLKEKGVKVSTVRAGNVIGGGDFSCDRIIPDCIRAAMGRTKIKIRNPESIRPYQHVLEALSAYLLIAERQYMNDEFAGSYNVGPEDADCIRTIELVRIFCEVWGEEIDYEIAIKDNAHEAKELKLDCTKLKTIFGWSPKWGIYEAVKKTIEWTKEYQCGKKPEEIMQRQLKEFTIGDSLNV